MPYMQRLCFALHKYVNVITSL